MISTRAKHILVKQNWTNIPPKNFSFERYVAFEEIRKLFSDEVLDEIHEFDFVIK